MSAQTTETFRVAVADGVGRLTLSRPEKRNAMSPSFWRDLPRAVQRLSDDGGVRVLVIDAEGPHFTAGMDVSVFAGGGLQTDAPHQRVGFMRTLSHLQDTFTALEEARFPVIAAVQGACIGAGVDMTTACDIRFASADAYFRIEEINIGMMADVGTLQRIGKIVGEGVAREMAYTGDALSAERAERTGLVNTVFPDHQALIAGALDCAAKIAAKPPLAIAGSKLALNYAREHAVADSLRHAQSLQAAIWSTDEIMEAIGSRSEKRKGAFTDLPRSIVMGETDA